MLVLDKNATLNVGDKVGFTDYFRSYGTDTSKFPDDIVWDGVITAVNDDASYTVYQKGDEDIPVDQLENRHKIHELVKILD